MENKEKFERVYKHLYEQNKEKLLEDVGVDFQNQTRQEIREEYQHKFDILLSKLEQKTEYKLKVYSLYDDKNKGFTNWVGYDGKYIALHPWIVLEKTFEEIKWAWQRVFRGWDDRVIWSIDWYLAKYIPQWLMELKSKKQGVPTSMYDEADFDNNFNTSKEGDAKAIAKYDAILDQIITAFESYSLLEDNFDPETYEEAYKDFREGFDLFRDFFGTLWD